MTNSPILCAPVPRRTALPKWLPWYPMGMGKLPDFSSREGHNYLLTLTKAPASAGVFSCLGQLYHWFRLEKPCARLLCPAWGLGCSRGNLCQFHPPSQVSSTCVPPSLRPEPSLCFCETRQKFSESSTSRKLLSKLFLHHSNQLLGLLQQSVKENKS